MLLRLIPCTNGRCAELGLHTHGGFQQHKCYMTFAQQCSYKYLLNSASIGYANKFKSLLLCGSVVIYVREAIKSPTHIAMGSRSHGIVKPRSSALALM